MSVPNPDQSLLPSQVDVQVSNSHKGNVNSGIIILAVALIFLVVAMSTAMIIGAVQFTRRLDARDETIDKLEQIVVIQQCQIEITGDYYEGVAAAFSAPSVIAGVPNPERQAGIDMIIDAGRRAGDPKSCKPTG